MTKIFLSSLIVFLFIALKPVVVHADDEEIANDNVIGAQDKRESAAENVKTEEPAPAGEQGSREKQIGSEAEDPQERDVPPPTEWEKSKDAREKAANNYMDDEMSRKSYYDPVPAPQMHGDLNTPTDASSGAPEAVPRKHHPKHKTYANRKKPQHAKKATHVASRGKKSLPKRKTAKSRAHGSYANN